MMIIKRPTRQGAGLRSVILATQKADIRKIKALGR
jgi:hypothetical protein